MKYRYHIGIDPGTKTGVAVWDAAARQFLSVQSMKAVEAEIFILENWKGRPDVRVVVEDTRGLRLPVSKQQHGASALKGVGSVHRDVARWGEYLEHHGIPYQMRPLTRNPLRKSTHEYFVKQTGWKGSTNEHGRDAAAQVWGS